jgi:hypothetical protein
MLSSKPTKSFRPGDCVIFSLHRRSTHPRLGAKEIQPERHGEGYLYLVDDFWLVTQSRGAQVVVKTSRGRFHLLETDDTRLRLASWWQRLIFRHRFPKLEPIALRRGLPARLGSVERQ